VPSRTGVDLLPEPQQRARLQRNISENVHIFTRLVCSKKRSTAREMRLSENTVKNYVYRIFNKLGVSNRVEVAMYAANQRPFSGNGSSSAARPSLVEGGIAMAD
jgi:hypothetical protein